MKLKHIELYGFKSFAEKTKLTFNKDISAVVGPNGSGKSNIADAIRWVLGEQSAKSLRGSNMQDVIFAGSESKKQMNMAQVSLILDNQDNTLSLDYDEINVTRRVFRTGESEYLINKSPVRLKDIRELFLDTGVGKDGYSLIGQGRIDEILNGKPEDRREIFEEASGISKNKYKKIEAERRLLKNQENIDKLNNEIKIKQQETDILEKQSNNAKEGIKLTSRLEKLELSMLKKSIDKINNDIINDKSKLDFINQDLEEKNKEYNILINRIAPIQADIEKKEEEYEYIRNKSIENEKKLQEYSSKIEILNEKLNFYNNDISRIREDIQNKKTKVDEIKNNIIKNERQLNELKIQKNKLSKDIDNFNSKKCLIEDNKKNLISVKINLEQSIQSKKNTLNSLQIDRNTKEKLDLNNEKLKYSYEIEIKNLNENIIKKHKKSDSIKKEISMIEKKINKNTDEINSLIENRNEENIILKSIEENILNSRNIYNRLESERNLLYRQYKSYDGYYKSVQNLLKISDNDNEINKRIVGVLADLISVEDRYKEAVDVALASALQNIVINNEEDGKFLINFIKNKNIGRITFLPITAINGKKNNIEHKLSLGNLNNLVQYDKRIEKIIDYYLSKTILCKNMDDAVILSKDIKGYRIITLDGDVINSWGSMVGGKSFRKEQNSLINRKKEINDIDKNLKVKKDNIQKLNDEYVINKQKLDDIIYELQKLDDDNKDLLIHLSDLRNELKEIGVEINFNNKRLDEFNILLKNVNDELKEIDFSGIENLNKDISIEENRLGKIQDDILKIDEEYNILEKDNVKIKINYEIIERDIKQKEIDIDNFNIDIENLNNNIENNNNILKITNNNIDNSIIQIDAITKNRDKILNNPNFNKESIDILKEELLKMKDNIKIDRNNIEKIKEQLTSSEKDRFKLELKIDNASQKIEELTSDYMDTYSIDKSTLDDKLKNLEVIEASKKEIIQIKNRLSDIGYFNYDSIEQFNIIFEELNFMKKQYQDLIISRDDIISLIKNIEKEMRENFKKSFEQIRVRFNKIFKILFDGGEADLELDSEDLLNAGIEINARPKGKKLKSIALLSGGEKAMTAVALLFSIFEINPAPFCVLDEIDAALDEANIQRYINYLKSLTEKTQFIIITHRKKTMEMAEILYGVTMEEQGISKVITLALDNFN